MCDEECLKDPICAMNECLKDLICARRMRLPSNVCDECHILLSNM